MVGAGHVRTRSAAMPCVFLSKRLAPGGILLSAYMCTTIIIILLCVLVWLMAYLWVIYS